MDDLELKEQSFSQMVTRYPQTNREAAAALIQDAIAKSRRTIIVLDDDPTGVQTVHGVPVYTSWTEESIDSGFGEAGFDEAGKTPALFFILTNSRGMTAGESAAVHREIGARIARVGKRKNRDYIIVSRSDSTLRGHYPLETETLKAAVEAESGGHFDGEIICPFFMEGGRFTAENIHYVRSADTMVPAAMTEFAKDKTFGYSHSDLTQWVEEKTKGAYKKESVTAIPLQTLRGEGAVQKVCDTLVAVQGFGKVIVNALDYDDIRVFGAALYRALDSGKRFMIRSAAAVPKILGGIPDRPLLTREELIDSGNPRGGLVVVGSHVQKTSRQLQLLLENPNVAAVEFNTHLVMDEAAFQTEIRRVQDECNKALEAGRITAVYTCRTRFDLNTGNPEDELRVSLKIAAAVTSFVSNLTGKPRFIIAKGGITSSQIGTEALGVKKALVLGQVLPGIPVWLTGPESRFPNTPYVIFPGNVGDEDGLKKIAEMLA